MPLLWTLCPCGKAVKGRTHIVGECEIYKEKRDVLEEMRKIDEFEMENFGTLDSSKKRIAIPGDSGHRRRNRKGISKTRKS